MIHWLYGLSLSACLGGLWMLSGCAENDEVTERDDQIVGYVEPEEQAPHRVPGDDPFRPAVPKMD